MNLLGPIGRDKRDRALLVEGLREEISACEAVHIARHWQPQEIQERGCDVNDRTSTLTRGDDR